MWFEFTTERLQVRRSRSHCATPPLTLNMIFRTLNVVSTMVQYALNQYYM